MTPLDLRATVVSINKAVEAMQASMLIAVDRKQDPNEVRIWVFHPRLDENETARAVEFMQSIAASGKFFPESHDMEACESLVGILWLRIGEAPSAFGIHGHPATEAFQAMTLSLFGTPTDARAFDAESGNAMYASGEPDESNLN